MKLLKWDAYNKKFPRDTLIILTDEVKMTTSKVEITYLRLINIIIIQLLLPLQ